MDGPLKTATHVDGEKGLIPGPGEPVGIAEHRARKLDWDLVPGYHQCQSGVAISQTGRIEVREIRLPCLIVAQQGN